MVIQNLSESCMIKLANPNQSPLKRPKIQRPSCRPFNSITIPRLQAKDQRQQLSKSSLLLISNSTNNTHDISNAYRCSTSNPKNADYFQFSKALLECKTFFEREKQSLIVVEKPSNQKPSKQPCFEKVLFFLNDHQFLSSLPSNCFNDLILVISSIFNSTNSQTIPSSLIYSDLPVYMKFSLFEEMSIIYNVFSNVLDRIDQNDLKTCITADLIRKVIKNIDVPDISERKILEGIALQIVKHIPEYKFFLLDCLFNLLQDHIDHLIPYFCIGSALQCISNILSLTDVKVTESQKSIILYLFNSYFLERFDWEMDIVLKKLYTLYPDFSEKVRNFLIFNWPNKDFQNSYYFLSFYISSLFRSKLANDDQIDKTADNNNDYEMKKYYLIVDKFYDCILSDNANNSLQAINFASNASVYHVMIKISPNFYDGFLKALKKIKTSWSPYVEEAIANSTQKIKELEKSNNESNVINTNTKPEKNKECNSQKLTWEDLKKMVNVH
ncbi:hypothetical protein M9Y10_016297 [Tritrichomonas musculus]|uniref:Phosphoprotein phosphatase n=1 Tax=Tritrichomonas musculus TaxID=1915356 RepID=A0ABR2HWW1_9EUKA